MMKFIFEITALTIVFWMEGTFPLFSGRENRVKHALSNLGLGALNALCISLFFSSATVGVAQWTHQNSLGLLNFVLIPPALKAILSFVLFDLWMYLWHIANHNLPFFWRFHRMHHSDLEMDFTTALRFHTGEIIFSSLIRLAVIPLLGIEFSHLFIYELVLQPIIIFHHSNVALPEKWDRLFRILIVTPNMHRVHHSQERFETNSNYSTIFSFWDRLGKTFQKRADVKTIHYGLPEFLESRWQTFIGMLKTPFA